MTSKTWHLLQQKHLAIPHKMARFFGSKVPDPIDPGRSRTLHSDAAKLTIFRNITEPRQFLATLWRSCFLDDRKREYIVVASLNSVKSIFSCCFGGWLRSHRQPVIPGFCRVIDDFFAELLIIMP
ncbi:unnamed protein product [Onchocerca flexuosa]|uniref:Uncharacterized protein n=1 Tax=Onchocerca flexuosa TaxID=387005 RepID=A0A183HGV3_9BILA|nr:unnamed protein product [Onchocerca flexuosa]